METLIWPWTVKEYRISIFLFLLDITVVAVVVVVVVVVFVVVVVAEKTQFLDCHQAQQGLLSIRKTSSFVITIVRNRHT